MQHTKEEACFHLKINMKTLDHWIEKALIEIKDNSISNEELYRILLQEKYYSMNWIDMNTLEYQELCLRNRIKEMYKIEY